MKPDKRQNAYNAIRHILAMPDVDDQTKKRLLTRMIWQITTVGGKYKIKYATEAALEAEKKELRHEHVYPRKFIIERFLERPGDYESILDKYAIACLVTKAEHNMLDHGTDGWERYKRAGLAVKSRE